jgi:outer membrane protein assembly factor BamE (lipoprotein component of BamABCDE complex)
MRSALLALLLLTTPACAIARTTENRPLVAEQLRSLRTGSTTAREVVELLGAPVDVVQLGKRSAYQYRFTSSKRAALLLLVVNLYNEDSRSDRAWVFFDENQVLTHVGTTLDGDQTEYAMPWEDLHD